MPGEERKKGPFAPALGPPGDVHSKKKGSLSPGKGEGRGTTEIWTALMQGNPLNKGRD